MTPNRVGLAGWAVSVAGLALLAAGCATTSEIPPQAISELAAMRNGLIDGKAQIQKTTGAARDLIDRPRQDVRAQVDAFTAQVAQLGKDAQQARELAAGTQARAEDFFAGWDRQLQTMSGSLAEAGQQRRTESMASFARLRERLAAVRTQFAPFMNDLSQVERYLRTDPTAAGVKAVTPTVRGALGHEASVLESIDELIAQIDAVRGGK
jgi:hypothetical protein